MLTSGSSGSGTGVVEGAYLALSNPTTNPRTGVITFTPSVGVPTAISFSQPASEAPLQQRQVTALYQSILGRDPDTGGYAFWTGSGAPQGAAGLAQMADDFLTSPEAFDDDFAIMAAYRAATRAPPTYAQFIAAGNAIRTGIETVPLLFSTLAAANANYSANTLYENLLNRPALASEIEAANQAGLAEWFQTLIGYPAAAVSPVSAPNNEFQSTGTFQSLNSPAGDHTNALYVTLLYFTIVGRDPDPSGFNFWIGVANSGGAGILFQGAATARVRLQMTGPGPGQGFTGSPEFQALYQ
jgi:hypothetical protein